jgi:hypothetical protein
MQMTDDFNVVLSPLEEARFGYRTARAKGVTSKNLPLVLDFCRNNRIQFLIARCHVNDIQAAQAMEKEGFFLTDTLVYYRRNLLQPIPLPMSASEIRPLKNGEVLDVSRIAGEAFQNYFDHYHADPNLDEAKCDEVYISWAVNACHSRDDDHEVLVAVKDGTICAFSVMRLNNPFETEGVLCGAAKTARRQKIYTDLIITGLNWSLGKLRTRMIISTQIKNIVVQKVWVHLGFEFYTAHYTFHRWLNV